jgi:hypothetical protein
MRLLLVCLAIVGLACPALACINDIELPTHEREFRSQYSKPASQPPTPSGDPSGPSGYLLLMSVGGALLTGAVGLAAMGGRPRS